MWFGYIAFGIFIRLTSIGLLRWWTYFNWTLCMCECWGCGFVVISQFSSMLHAYLLTLFWRYELGRQPANTKLSSNKTVRRVRVRGGNVKWRALRLDTGNYSWGSEAVTRKTRILDVVYNASNNELVRTQTLVKSAIVQVDAAPFKQWYLQHYGVDIGRKKKAAAKKETTEVILIENIFYCHYLYVNFNDDWRFCFLLSALCKCL